MLNDRRLTLALVLTAWALTISVSAARVPRFFPLGFATPDAFESEATDVSADGSVVIGQSTSMSDLGEYLTAGFLWTADTSIALVNGYPDPYLATYAYGVSPDGKWAVGMAAMAARIDGGNRRTSRYCRTSRVILN